MSGRGAWPASGAGGTLNYDGDGPGPFYRLATGNSRLVGEASSNANERAVRGAVKAYQKALRRRLKRKVKADGLFGPVTEGHVKDFQERAGLTVDGVVGRDTSRELLWPDLRRKVNNLRRKYPNANLVTPVLVCGVITHESNWDAGAVGYLDERDVGLAQINAEAHPEWSEAYRLAPIPCFAFVFNYMKNAIEQLGDIKLAVASYNLGIGGARTWDRKGRPNPYTPAGSTTPRDMEHYITNIRNVCKDMR